MIYGKFIDSTLEYERYNDNPEPEFTIEFTPEDEHAYRALLAVEGGFRSSKLQGKVKAATQQTEDEGWVYRPEEIIIHTP